MNDSIALACPFYPWSRTTERTEEIFKIMVPSLNRLEKWERIELALLHMGDRDIWCKNRKHDVNEFKQRLDREWRGRLTFITSNGCIHPGPPEQLWMSKAKNEIIRYMLSDRFMAIGIDITLPPDFVGLYDKRVGTGSAWIITPAHVDKDFNFLSWRTVANGMIGMTRKDYFSVGGCDESMIRSQYDNDFAKKVALSPAIGIIKEKVEGVYHVAHPR